MDDLEFVHRCVKKDKESWGEFVDKYSCLIYNYIHSVLRTKGLFITEDNLNDLFQEFFLSLIKDNFKKLRSFKARNGCTLASWLRQVVINYTIDYTRRFKPVVSLEEENRDGLCLRDILSDGATLVNQRLGEEERFISLKECIEGLDIDDKFFLELYLNQDLTLGEIKDIFGVSRPVIDMRKSRILDRLRSCFRDKGFTIPTS